MVRTIIHAGGLILAAGIGAGQAGAQDPPPSALKFTSDLGFVKTGGNTDLTTLSLAEKVEYAATERLALQQTLGWVLGRTEGEESANQLLAGVRGSYVIAGGLSAYAGANYYKDRFAGVSKRFDESFGLGYQVLKTDRHDLKVEAGIGFFHESPLTGPTDNFTAGRAAGGYKYSFGAKAYLQQQAEYLPNFDNTGDFRVTSESSLVAPLNSVLALKVGYLVRHRGEPPTGFDKTDTTFRTSIQVTL